jgi:hypothetical protein
MNADAIISLREIIFLSVFAVLVFGVPAMVAWASYSDRFKLDLTTLWTHQGRVDKLAVIIVASWWIHSCAMILETMLRTTQTQDWTTYQLWAVPIIAKMVTQAFGSSETPDKPA